MIKLEPLLYDKTHEDEVTDRLKKMLESSPHPDHVVVVLPFGMGLHELPSEARHSAPNVVVHTNTEDDEVRFLKSRDFTTTDTVRYKSPFNAPWIADIYRMFRAEKNVVS